MKVAQELHDQLTAAGIDVLLDDRDCRAGVKFKDADLIGIPLRVVIGDRGLKEGKLEVKWRWEKAAQQIELEGAAETLAELIRTERQTATRFQNR
jgi:prolyl-tRNA synthetase